MSTESIKKLKEDFFVQATLDISGERIEGVPCKIYLPDSTMDKPFFWFRPAKSQHDILSQIRYSLFTARIDGFNGKNEAFIFSPKVHFSKKSTRHLRVQSS